MEMFFILSFILNCALMAMGEDSTVVNLSEELAALNKSARQHLSAQGKEKPILRYGFQKTDLCMDYERAFLCVRKCLDIGYDVAYADKRCKCTCFRKKEKARYTPAGQNNRTNYRLGTPTTKLPAWAQPPTPEAPKPLNIEDSDEDGKHHNSYKKGNNGSDDEEANDGKDNSTDPESGIEALNKTSGEQEGSGESHENVTNSDSGQNKTDDNDGDSDGGSGATTEGEGDE